MPIPGVEPALPARTRLIVDLERAVAATRDPDLAGYLVALQREAEARESPGPWYTARPDRLSQELARISTRLEPEANRMLTGIDHAGRMCAVGKLALGPRTSVLVGLIFADDHPRSTPRVLAFVEGSAVSLPLGLDQEWTPERDADFVLDRAAAYLRSVVLPRLGGGRDDENP